MKKTIYQGQRKIDSSTYKKIIYTDDKPSLEIVYINGSIIDYKKKYSYKADRLIAEETIPSSVLKRSKIEYEYSSDGQLNKEIYSFNNKISTIKEYKYVSNKLLSITEYEKKGGSLILLSKDINVYNSSGQLLSEFVLGPRSDTNYFAFFEYNKGTSDKRTCSYGKTHKLIQCLEEYFDSLGRIKEEIVLNENKIKSHSYYQYNQNGEMSELKKYDGNSNLIYEEHVEPCLNGGTKKLMKDFKTDIVATSLFDRKKRKLKEITRNGDDVIILDYTYSQSK